MMQGATEFMSDTLNNVLNMHKIEEGKLELEKVPFSIVESATKVGNSRARNTHTVYIYLVYITHSLFFYRFFFFFFFFTHNAGRVGAARHGGGQEHPHGQELRFQRAHDGTSPAPCRHHLAPPHSTSQNSFFCSIVRSHAPNPCIAAR